MSNKSCLAFGGPATNYWESVAHAFASSDGGLFIVNSDVMGGVAVAKLDAQGNLPKDCASLAWNVARSKSSYKLVGLSIP